MIEKKRILILTADAGFGHRSAALAIQAALQEIYGDDCDAQLVNPLEDKRTLFFLRDSQADYDRIVREAPEIYKLGYDASDKSLPSAVVETTLMLLLFEVMRDLVTKFHPDAIVTTYPLYQSALEAVFTVERIQIPLYTVVTDLASVHRLWFHNVVTTCMVPNSLVKNMALASNLRPDQVMEIGIPVSPRIYQETRSKSEIRRELGWDENRVTILAVGSKRTDRLLEAVNTLNHSGYPVQIAIAAGKDAEFYEQIQSIEWHKPAFMFDFANNLPLLMHASDAIICKAGGLIVTESLACGLPILLVDLLPGQETGNAEYILQHEAGDMAETSFQVLEIISHWLENDCAILKSRSENSRMLGRPYAARDIADIVWQGAQNKPIAKKKSRIPGRSSLINFIKKYDSKLTSHLAELRQRLDHE
jgi:1,2-diacylglycerol 3-beta-galactosyltransferase